MDRKFTTGGTYCARHFDSGNQGAKRIGLDQARFHGHFFMCFGIGAILLDTAVKVVGGCTQSARHFGFAVATVNNLADGFLPGFLCVTFVALEHLSFLPLLMAERSLVN